MSTELLMRQLLKLDGIEAEGGEVKLQRKAEVHRVQNFVDTLDSLKAKNSNPYTTIGKAVSVATQWETFDSGMGSLNAPTSMTSSRNVSQVGSGLISSEIAMVALNDKAYTTPYF
ncbi:hypothetical protein JHK86_050980 [Glycine max]|nr:hypothetical protein JHK86_050980 [Glycine max]